MADITSIRNNLSTATTPARDNSGLPVRNVTLPTRIDHVLTALDSYPSFNFPLENIPLKFKMQISDYSRQSLQNIGTLNNLGVVSFPLPISMVDGHGVSYEESAIGSVMGGIVNVGTAFANYGVGSMKSYTDAAKSLAGSATALGIEAAGDAGNVLRAKIGKSPNQFMTILLKGPQYKKHQFTWKFSPRSPAESAQLNLIIRILNNAMSPGLTGGGVLFTFPKIFSISITEKDAATPYIFKFKPAVLENMSVNFTPAGAPVFTRPTEITGGWRAPEAIEIQMQFLELEYWLSGDFQGVDPISGPKVNEPPAPAVEHREPTGVPLPPLGTPGR